MKRFYLLLLLPIIGMVSADAQNIKLSRFIVVTDTVTDEEVTFAASSDDAEQENDAIDALYDDDIDAGWEGDPEDFNILTAGMRFQNITIPADASIDSAYIIVYSHESKTAEDVARITIAGEASDNASTYTEDMLITDRPRTNAQLLWEVAEEWGLWTPHHTIDLSEIVQEIVDRDGWESGNSMAFMFLGEDQGASEVENAREWESFENIADPEDGGDGQNHPERIPELVIYYSIQSGLFTQVIQVTDTVTDEGVTFAASSDDAEQENDAIDALFDDDIDAGWEGDPEDFNILTAGMRFRDIAIPPGATIDSVFIEVFSHESKTPEDVARITVSAEATDDAQTFTEDQLITDRTQTEAKILWEVAEEWGLWTPHLTPDLKDIVQEIVNRDGWEAGNSIAFIFQGEDQGASEVENAREWESYENIADPEDGGDGQNHPERIPKLYIYFTSEGSTSVLKLNSISEKSLLVFPNPSENNIQIELETNDPAVIRIFNIQGELMLTKETEFGRLHSLSTQQFPSGTYIISAMQNGELIQQKLVKQ